MADRALLLLGFAPLMETFPTGLALVGPCGEVLLVNHHWRNLPFESPFIREVVPGTDYISMAKAMGANGAHLNASVLSATVLGVAEAKASSFPVEVPLEEGGKRLWLSFIASGFEVEGERYLLLSAADITRKMEVQDRLKKNEYLFTLLTDHITDLIALVDRNGKRLWTSPSYSRALGWSDEELETMEPMGLMDPAEAEEMKNALQKIFSSGRGMRIEFRLRCKDGSYRDFESSSEVVRNPSGEKEAILFSARDITERKRAEREKANLEVQLRNAQKMEGIGQLSAGIAHEINTPIQYIGDNTRFLRESFDELFQVIQDQRSFLSSLGLSPIDPSELRKLPVMLSNQNLDYLIEEIPRAAAETLEGVERVAKIIKALKEFSHPGAEEAVMMDLNKCIETTVTVARNEWKYHVELTTELDPGLPSVPGFPGEFNQVVLNLLVNAVHAIQDTHGSSEKGHIWIRTWQEEAQAKVSLQDDGSGIPPHIIHRIFEPFFTTKGVGRGTGQGLSIVHGVMDRHQGRVEVASKSGEGTTFILTFPLKRTESAGEIP